MKKLSIKKRGRCWVLLEGRKGLDAYMTKQEAFAEMEWMRDTAREKRERDHSETLPRLRTRRMPPLPDNRDQMARIKALYLQN